VRVILTSLMGHENLTEVFLQVFYYGVTSIFIKYGAAGATLNTIVSPTAQAGAQGGSALLEVMS